MKLPRLSSSKANFIYLVVLFFFVYSWPYTVYGKIGSPMPLQTDRQKLIADSVARFAQVRKITIFPKFRIGSVPASAGALSGQAVVIVSPSMLEPDKFSDQEVEFILAHEVGHLERHDAYRFWTTWRRAWAEERELAADKIGVELTSCQAMSETIRRHVVEFMAGFSNHNDPHPHPQRRLQISCPDLKTHSDPTGRN